MNGERTPIGSLRRFAAVPAAIFAVWASAGCGASLYAVYEGDVRFEHCMALDAQPTVKASIRRACWSEWVSFYTYGQTRDRVVHAQMRMRQLDGDVGPGEGSQGIADPPPLSGPEPVTAMASPPATAPEVPLAAEGEHCATRCRAAQDDCESACSNAHCKTSCATGFVSCVGGCG